ncbi:hypothetical protein G5I_10432 [Acromyrmex echinatior]|uniref:Uncharacterized protein n=1 Tax=Acromyrmex echinatior TaxID=103372 RepID=F4WWV9_ACREC|nr:hypothetical protein G5I_10432 [Acromyrmex echinatior]
MNVLQYATMCYDGHISDFHRRISNIRVRAASNRQVSRINPVQYVRYGPLSLWQRRHAEDEDKINWWFSPQMTFSLRLHKVRGDQQLKLLLRSLQTSTTIATVTALAADAEPPQQAQHQ